MIQFTQQTKTLPSSAFDSAIVRTVNSTIGDRRISMSVAEVKADVRKSIAQVGFSPGAEVADQDGPNL